MENIISSFIYFTNSQVLLSFLLLLHMAQPRSFTERACRTEQSLSSSHNQFSVWIRKECRCKKSKHYIDIKVFLCRTNCQVALGAGYVTVSNITDIKI